VVRALVALLFLMLPLAASAQDANALRAQARRAIAAGEFERGLSLLTVAAPLTDDPQVWLELGDAADRVRRDDIALEAYETYLERVPRAANVDEVTARVRILRRTLEGYQPRAFGPAERLLVDWYGHPLSLRSRRAVRLADWEGQVIERDAPPPRRLATLSDWDGPHPPASGVPLADWDGNLQTAPAVQPQPSPASQLSTP
jgi:tetratricopeptide (TPR) repeat protein